ncbi:TIGR03089 family protein [Pseudonocardia sichuanensis]
MTLTAALLGPLLSGAAAARPLITFYDDATGERVELSATTTANWAAKAANLLREECDVEPGTPVAVLLPAHWQTAAVLLAAWWCGATVTEPAEAEWVLCDAERVDLALAAEPAGGVVALSLDAFGAGVPGLPAGVVDFATEVRLQGDEFVPWSPVPENAPALAGATVGEVLACARARAGELGFSRGDRVLSTLDWSTGDGLRDGLLAVLAAEASLVQVRHPDEEAMGRRAATERTTVRLA